MTDKEITERLRARFDITELRPMQAELLHTHATAVVLIAPTGSGKTVAFGAYLLRRISASGNGVKALVTVPSRELARQVAEVLRAMAPGIKVTAVYGGHRMDDETPTLTPAPDVLVATPGRLLDHVERGHISLSSLSTWVVDEYDKLLELGFEGEMRHIARLARARRNIVLTSATEPDTLPAWLGSDKPLTLRHDAEEPAGRIEVVEVTSATRDKVDTLAALLRSVRPRKAIVFVNHRDAAERLAALLRERGVDCALYHGGLDQPERQRALELLANGSAPVLVATDLASRGLDIEGVDAVVHYHMPTSPEAWTHRSGRTARAGAPGTVYIITSEADSTEHCAPATRAYAPPLEPEATRPLKADMATLHINAGRKEKISRGDVAGFLMTRGGLAPSEVGRIAVADHETLVAVPRAKAAQTIAAAAPYKLKNKRVRITVLKQ